MTYQIKEIDGKFQLWQTGENTHQLLGAYDTREEAKEKIKTVSELDFSVMTHNNKKRGEE